MSGRSGEEDRERRGRKSKCTRRSGGVIERRKDRETRKITPSTGLNICTRWRDEYTR